MEQPREGEARTFSQTGQEREPITPPATTYGRQVYPENSEKREMVSKATMDFFQEKRQELDQLNEWFLEIRPIVAALGKSHKQQNIKNRRAAQNSLWRNFRENIWGKKLLLNPDNFQGSAHEQQEQAKWFKEWEQEIVKAEPANPKSGEPRMPAIKALATTLYQELEQHWCAEELPKDLQNFPFRVAVWLERMGKAKSTLQNILNQIEVINS